MIRALRVLGVALLAFAGLLTVALVVLRQWHPGLEQMAAHRYVPAPAVAGTPTLFATWFGTTAVLLDDGEHALLIDPFFTRPPGLLPLLANRPIAPDEALIRRWLQQAGVERLDAVLVSHSHYDHAMDAGVVARLTGATLVGSASTANIGRGAGLAESQLRVIEGDAALAIGPYRVQWVRSRHAGATGGAPTGDITAPLSPPARYLDYRQGGTWSILVEHAAGTVLHHGSAGHLPGALRGRHADVAFLGVALIDDLPRYLGDVVDPVGARRIVPVHWDDFTRPLDAPLVPFPVLVRLDRFFEGMRARPDLAVQTLAPGERVRLLP